MWLSEKTAGSTKSGGAEFGTVTIGGGSVGVMTDSERRGLKVYGPGGYVWRPRTGESLLVLKCGEEGAQSCVAGTEPPAAPPNMENGEIYITSASGTSLYLKNDGRVLLTGQLYINGIKVEV